MKYEELNDLFDYVPLKIYQNKKYFKFSLDSILLAEYVKNPSNAKSILELCAGNCAISMILSTKTDASITALEIQKDVYELGLKSIHYNKLEDRITLINDDIKNTENYFPGNKYDIILCNPPYFKVDDNSLKNKNNVKAMARHEISIKLEEIINISSKMLDLNGELYLVHKPERLDDIIIYCDKYNINVKNITFISTKIEKEPKLVLVRCIKGSSRNLKISENLCIEGLKSFKNIFWKE